MKTPQIPALPGCTPLGLKPQPTTIVIKCDSCTRTHEIDPRTVGQPHAETCVHCLNNMRDQFSVHMAKQHSRNRVNRAVAQFVADALAS